MPLVQHLGPVHEARFLWGLKARLERDTTPILVSSPRTPLTIEPGSMAQPPTQARRSSRRGRGSNGRDVQLDKLGDLLAAPARQTKKRFAPSDGLSLPNNLLAPVPKKRRSKKATLPPPTASQPCEQLFSNIDPRLGFSQPPSTPSSPISPPQALAQPTSRLSPYPAQPLSSPPVAVSPAFLSHAPTPSFNSLSPPSVTASPARPSRAPTPSFDNSDHHLSDPESDGGDADIAQDDDIEIDERSDDEDDRAAHEFLRSEPTATNPFANGSPMVLPYSHQGFSELGNDTSVLQAHYARNCTPKAPNPSRIQRSPSVNPLPPPPQQENTNTSRTLSTYPPQWQEVICYAKQSFRAYVAGKNGFPDALTGVQEARECLDDALAVHLDDGGVVEPGQTIDRDMIMLVYAESWLLRSQLKTDLRTQVRNLKSLFPDRFTGTAQELQSKVKATIDTWVRDGSYLHDVTPGSDDQIHFAHPIIASTTKLFYFDKWHEISTHDPDTFKGAVPKPLVALIGAIYRNAIDEWSNGYPRTVKLERKPYKEVYDEILHAMASVEDDPIDGPCFQERLAAWAGFGMSMNSQTNTASRILTTISLKLSSK
ncbi:hypothetical protein BJ322DRAFT_1220931 [Thelephora terrestris]|uniref:DUF6532 domain-containing protein n=1 Tax=Thelephora terrestris TaxID=56493 RepID=A0A9P6H6M6_9AGAM|nr:hypothetical protein BJ322DRAFT_1220931 [Thelephora terrestris]